VRTACVSSSSGRSESRSAVSEVGCSTPSRETASTVETVPLSTRWRSITSYRGPGCRTTHSPTSSSLTADATAARATTTPTLTTCSAGLLDRAKSLPRQPRQLTGPCGSRRRLGSPAGSTSICRLARACGLNRASSRSWTRESCQTSFLACGHDDLQQAGPREDPKIIRASGRHPVVTQLDRKCSRSSLGEAGRRGGRGGERHPRKTSPASWLTCWKWSAPWPQNTVVHWEHVHAVA